MGFVAIVQRRDTAGQAWLWQSIAPLRWPGDETAMSNPSPLQNYIGGRFVASESGERFENLNPADGCTVCQVEQAGAAEVEKAVVSAIEATKSSPSEELG